MAQQSNSAYKIDSNSAFYHLATMHVHVEDIKNARTALRKQFEAARGLFGGDTVEIRSALGEAWNYHVGVQCQAAQSKGSNAVDAFKAVVGNLMAGDEDMALEAAQGAGKIPQDVMTMTDLFTK